MPLAKTAAAVRGRLTAILLCAVRPDGRFCVLALAALHDNEDAFSSLFFMHDDCCFIA
jgi:hypothetical protein